MIQLQIIIFIIGYLAIIFEHQIKVHKTASALVTAVLLWAVHFITQDGIQPLNAHLSDTSQIVFFLVGAMGIVELIDAHQGFSLITRYLNFQKKSSLLWAIGLTSFFLSAVLDNLTTTIAMISILRKILPEKQDRWIFGSLVVIAANAGGAWTPIGDVTTTMLWMNGEITSLATMKALFLPSFLSTIACTGIFQMLFLKKDNLLNTSIKEKATFESTLIFSLGIATLIAVPIFKAITHLPPYMGMLIGLALLWIITDRLYPDKEEKKLVHALKKIDLASGLFFMGILLAIGALETSGVLHGITQAMGSTLQNETLIATVIGMASAVIDNVPLVAACMGMYPISDYAVDSSFWQLIAYCSGTGGSLLIIGSAAGVAFMGLEKVPFTWYLKKITLPATVAYFLGILIYKIL